MAAPPSEIWAAYNPMFESDLLQEMFFVNTPPIGSMVRLINWDENPFVNEVLLAEIQAAKDKPYYEHVFMGKCRGGGSLFNRESLLGDGQPVDYPSTASYLLAVIDCGLKDTQTSDGTACVFFARSLHYGHPLIVLDYFYEKMNANTLSGWLPSVFDRIYELSAAIHNAPVASIYIEDQAGGITLLQDAHQHNMQGIQPYWPVQAIPGHMCSMGKKPRAFGVSGFVTKEMIKFSRYAYEKRVVFEGRHTNHLLNQVLSYQTDMKLSEVGHDDASDCFTYGIALTLGGVDFCKKEGAI